MADEELTKKINSEIGMSKLTIDDLPRIFERKQLKEVTKIATFIENKLEQIQNLKRQVEQTWKGKPEKKREKMKKRKLK